MFFCNRSIEKSNPSGLGSGQGQIPGSGPKGAKLTDQKVILTDDFDLQLVNFENPVYLHIFQCKFMYKNIVRHKSNKAD